MTDIEQLLAGTPVLDTIARAIHQRLHIHSSAGEAVCWEQLNNDIQNSYRVAAATAIAALARAGRSDEETGWAHLADGVNCAHWTGNQHPPRYIPPETVRPLRQVTITIPLPPRTVDAVVVLPHGQQTAQPVMNPYRIRLAPEIPVTVNFDPTRPAGTARPYLAADGSVRAHLTLTDPAMTAVVKAAGLGRASYAAAAVTVPDSAVPDSAVPDSAVPDYLADAYRLHEIGITDRHADVNQPPIIPPTPPAAGAAAAAVDTSRVEPTQPVPAAAARHPEDYCHRCGGPNVTWSAPSPLWNQIMRGGSINGDWEFDEIICPTCFCVLGEERGVATFFRVGSDEALVPLETVTPTGRIWSDEVGLWLDPNNLGQALERLDKAEQRIRDRRRDLLAARETTP